MRVPYRITYTNYKTIEVQTAKLKKVTFVVVKIPMFLFWLLCLPNLSIAQVENTTTGELLENFFQDNETASESDAQQYLEDLDNLRARPLDLNFAEKEELQALRFLNELQIEKISYTV